MAALINLHDLFLNLLKDMYYAEKLVLKTLPKMQKAVGKDSKLAAAFQKHEQETSSQLARLGKVFELVGERPRAKTCHAMDGIMEKAQEVMDSAKNKDVLEAGLLADLQVVAHYEIARYGTLKAWAQMLGYDKAAKLLLDTLNEEKKTDTTLSAMSMREINERALNANGAATKKQRQGRGRPPMAAVIAQKQGQVRGRRMANSAKR